VCQVRVLPNPALVDGAKRYLLQGTPPHALEVVGGNAFQFATARVATRAFAGIVRQHADFESALMAFASQFAPAAGMTFDVTRTPVTVPSVGDETAAYAGTFDAYAEGGEHVVGSLAILLYRHDTIVVQLLSEAMAGDTGVATPVATADSPRLEELTVLARQMVARSADGPVVWSTEHGHCQGGLFALLPSPEDVPGATVSVEQQLVGQP
jgi:hypothetical protein